MSRWPYVYKKKSRRVLAGAFDAVGYGLKSLGEPFFGRNKLAAADVKKALFIRLDHLGDMIFLTPALRQAREIFPKAHLTLLAGPWAGEVASRCPFVDAVKVVSAPWFDRNHPHSFDM